MFRPLILTSAFLIVSIEIDLILEIGHVEYTCIDSDGMVYIADCDNNRIQKFTPRVRCWLS